LNDRQLLKSGGNWHSSKSVEHDSCQARWDKSNC
jgi:hypothetical protein